MLLESLTRRFVCQTGTAEPSTAWAVFRRRATTVSSGLAMAALALLLTGCGAEPSRSLDPVSPFTGEICDPTIAKPPCSAAKPNRPYRTTVYTNCGVRNAYFAGRWWYIEPPQPAAGMTWITGTMTRLDADLADFHGDNGQRYSFTAAPRSYEPAPCY